MTVGLCLLLKPAGYDRTQSTKAIKDLTLETKVNSRFAQNDPGTQDDQLEGNTGEEERVAKC